MLEVGRRAGAQASPGPGRRGRLSASGTGPGASSLTAPILSASPPTPARPPAATTAGCPGSALLEKVRGSRSRRADRCTKCHWMPSARSFLLPGLFVSRAGQRGHSQDGAPHGEPPPPWRIASSAPKGHQRRGLPLSFPREQSPELGPWGGGFPPCPVAHPPGQPGAYPERCPAAVETPGQPPPSAPPGSAVHPPGRKPPVGAAGQTRPLARHAFPESLWASPRSLCRGLLIKAKNSP